MTTRALLLCDGAPAPPGIDDLTLLRERIDWRRASDNVNFRADNFEDTALGIVDGRAADLIQIAISAFAADQAVSRGGKADVYGRDWHREMHLAVPVRDPEFWSAPEVSERLTDALMFATEDTWRFTFSPFSNQPHQLVLAPGDRDMIGQPDHVVLFSGGADSLCATVELLAGGQGRPLLVSHRSTAPTVKRQTDLAHLLRERFPRQAPSHVSFWIHRRLSDAKDTSQRSRGFLFASLGASVAVQLGLERVVFSDNGVVSLNLPINRSVVGAMASRSTHPGFLTRFNRLLQAIFERPVRVENTLALRTRAETLEILKAHGCADLLQETISCSHPRGRSELERHCGYCSQCIDRRFGTLAAGLDEHDLAERYELDAFVDSLPEGEARTIAVSYVRLANRLSRMTPDEMFLEIQELNMAIDPTSRSVDDDARALAQMLRRHGVAVGEALGRVARQVADDLGHGRLPETCLLRLAFGGAGELRAVEAQKPESPIENLVRQEGRLWRIRFSGHEAFVPDEVGLTYLSHLLLSAGEQIDVVKLLSLRSANRSARRSAEEDMAALQGGSGIDDDLADRQTREDYRRRLQELNGDRSRAERDGDEIALALIEKEFRAIERELKRVTGLAGKPRKFQDERGKARQSVSRAIDRACNNILKAHAPLGRHLKAFVRTGYYCSYQPEPSTNWIR